MTRLLLTAASSRRDDRPWEIQDRRHTGVNLLRDNVGCSRQLSRRPRRKRIDRPVLRPDPHECGSFRNAWLPSVETSLVTAMPFRIGTIGLAASALVAVSGPVVTHTDFPSQL